MFLFKRLQSDPNPANFSFQLKKSTDGIINLKIVLMDFGSCLILSDKFMKEYLDVVLSAILRDNKKCLEASKSIGFLSGLEREEMISTWCTAMQYVGEPFSKIF